MPGATTASSSLEAREAASALNSPTVIAEDSLGISLGPPGGQSIFFDDAAGVIHIVEGRMVSYIEIPRIKQHTAAAQPLPSPSPATAPPHHGSSNLDASETTTPTEHTPREHHHNTSSLLTRDAPVPSPGIIRHARSTSLASSISSTGTSSAFLVSEGPAITAVRASLDGAATALQRSKLQIEFLDHATGNMFVAAPENREAELRGFFWTDCPGAEFVMVTSHGLELFSLQSQGLKPSAAQRLASLQWFIWSHACRVLVAGCGATGAKLQSFQFTPGGMVRLPLLDLTPPWGSPTKGSRAAPWLLVGPSQVWVLLLYQRVFIAHHEVATGVLKLYRLYRDATALRVEISCAIGSALELSVVDNVLVLHTLENGSVSLVDVARAVTGNGIVVHSVAPVCPPAPLGVSSPAGDAGADDVAGSTLEIQEIPEMGSQRGEEGDEREGGADVIGSSSSSSARRLELHHPDFALDTATGRLLVLKLNLQAVAEACTDDPAGALSFILRRRRSAAPNRDPPHVALGVLRRAVGNRSKMSILRSAFDAVHAAAAVEARQQQAATQTPQHSTINHHESSNRLASLDEELVGSILAPLLRPSSPINELHSDSRNNDTSSSLLYLQGSLAELLASCHVYSLGIEPSVAQMYIQVYCLRGQAELLPLLLESHAPLLDSPELAAKLEEWGIINCDKERESRRENTRENTQSIAHINSNNSRINISFKLAQRASREMWQRLHEPVAACRGLLQEGRVIEALRAIKAHGLESSMVAQECVEAAVCIDEGAVLLEAAERMLDGAAGAQTPEI